SSTPLRVTRADNVFEPFYMSFLHPLLCGYRQVKTLCTLHFTPIILLSSEAQKISIFVTLIYLGPTGFDSGLAGV
ncbi:MAG: hypothetical protein ACRC3B_01785, partial [Bacteroidia bacterium]